MPVGDVLVCDTRGNVEHDDTALSVDVVTVSETTELLLTGGIPDLELDLSVVGVESKRTERIVSTSTEWESLEKRTGPRHPWWQCISSRTHQLRDA